MKYFAALLLFILMISCAPKKVETETSAAPEPETTSFSGTPLYAKPADSLASIKSDSLIGAIRSKAELSEDDYIAIGRSLVGVNQFRKAVETYSEGLAKFPDSYRLLRHRGHRYINLRQLDKAIVDLIDADGFLGEQYTLEFSSPGLDRPLISTKDFVRNLNREVRFILNTSVEGKREWTGLVTGADLNSVIVVTKHQKHIVVPLGLIMKAVLVI